jgi:hypothetical protein
MEKLIWEVNSLLKSNFFPAKAKIPFSKIQKKIWREKIYAAREKCDFHFIRVSNKFKKKDWKP